MFCYFKTNHCFKTAVGLNMNQVSKNHLFDKAKALIPVIGSFFIFQLSKSFAPEYLKVSRIAFIFFLLIASIIDSRKGLLRDTKIIWPDTD